MASVQAQMFWKEPDCGHGGACQPEGRESSFSVCWAPVAGQAEPQEPPKIF